MLNEHQLNIGIGICGSFCTINKVIDNIKNYNVNEMSLFPYMSINASQIDTRFNKASYIVNRISDITHNKVITTIEEAEPVGPKKTLDAFVIAPCTGNTLAKLANGIIDGPVLMAAKATLRNQRPVIIALATNDGLSLSLKNISTLLNMKNIYFVPFSQDDHVNKSNSLVAHMDLIFETLNEGLKGKQLQPLLR